MVMIAGVVLLAGMASSASAAGDAAVDTLIVKNALPGWIQVSDSVLNLTVANERRAVGAVTGHTFQVGVDGWAEGDQSLIVVLISFPNGDVPSNFRARDAVIGACGAASRNAPRNLHSYPLITGSTEAQCSGTTTAGAPIDAAVMSWQKKDIFALVIGNRFTASELERFAVSQDAALPGDVSAPSPAPSVGDSSSTSSSSRAGEIVGALFLIALVGGVVFLLIARSRAKMPAPVQALRGPGGSAPYSPFAPPAAAPVNTPGAAAPASPYATSEPQPQSQAPASSSPFVTNASAASPSPFVANASAASPSPFVTSAPAASPSPVAAPASASAAPRGAAPGWQPIDGDPTRIAYWDGTAYTAWKRWDGSNWID
jgi:hypothetical protein